jgi:hypothetical protein
VAGALGGVLGALLIASLIALFLLFRSRKNLRKDYAVLQLDRDTAAQQGQKEKLMLEQELEQQRAQNQMYQTHMQAPVYSPPHQQFGAYFQPSPALPAAYPVHGQPVELKSPHERSYEMDTIQPTQASELPETASRRQSRQMAT